MQENISESTAEHNKELLNYTLLGLGIAILTALVFAILIHGDGSNANPFVRDPDTLPGVAITIANPNEDSIVDIYFRLYYSEDEVKSDDLLLNGIKLRTVTGNDELYIDPNLLDQGKGYLAIEVIEPHGYTIQNFKGSDVEIKQAAGSDSILIADLQRADPSLRDVIVEIKLTEVK